MPVQQACYPSLALAWEQFQERGQVLRTNDFSGQSPVQKIEIFRRNICKPAGWLECHARSCSSRRINEIERSAEQARKCIIESDPSGERATSKLAVCNTLHRLLRTQRLSFLLPKPRVPPLFLPPSFLPKASRPSSHRPTFQC